MLVSEKTVFTFSEVVAFVFLLQGKALPMLQLVVVTDWLPGNDTVCAFHGQSRKAEHTSGERMCEPQVSDMNVTDAAPAERPHYYHGKYWENKRTIFRTEGYLLLLVEYFLIMILSWSEYDSMPLLASVHFGSFS